MEDAFFGLELVDIADWGVTDVTGGFFDVASEDALAALGGDLTNSISISEVEKFFGSGFNKVLEALGGKGGTAGALKNLVALLRGGIGTLSDLRRSDALRDRYLKEALLYTEQLNLLGIETPLLLDKIKGELGWAQDQFDIGIAQSQSESRFTRQIGDLRGNQIDARIEAMMAELALFPLQAQLIDQRQQTVRGTLDIRSRILAGDKDALRAQADLGIRGLQNQAEIIQAVAAFESETRRIQMIRENAQHYVNQAHYGVWTGGASSTMMEGDRIREDALRQIRHINSIAGMRVAGLGIQSQQLELQRDNGLRQIDGQLELLNLTAGGQLAEMDIEKLILAARAAAAGKQISAAELDKAVLEAQTALALTKQIYDRNLLQARMDYVTGSLNADLDLVEARADSRGRQLGLQIAGARDSAEVAAASGDWAMLGRGLDLLLGTGFDVVTNLFGEKGSVEWVKVASEDKSATAFYDYPNTAPGATEWGRS